MKKLLFVLLILSILLAGCGKKGPTPEETSDPIAPTDTADANNNDAGDIDIEIEIPTDEVINNPSPLTGLEMENKYQPVAIMVENFSAARPYSGIIDADIVYEAHNEGGLTRFLAIFQSKSPKIVGPVRSVRHYFMWMAEEWDAYLVHFGQSFIAAERFDKIKVKRLNGLYTDKPFWRDNSRKAPHNVYIDVNKVREKIDFEQSAKGFSFISENKRQGSPYKSITIPYNTSTTLVEYKYDDTQKLNMRYINRKKDVEKETGKQLFAKNIIIQYAVHTILEPGAGYRDVALVGSGKAQYFMDGQWLEGTWERKAPEDRTIFYDQDKKEMEFLRGNSWIQIVQTDMKVSVN